MILWTIIHTWLQNLEFQVCYCNQSSQNLSSSSKWSSVITCNAVLSIKHLLHPQVARSFQTHGACLLTMYHVWYYVQNTDKSQCSIGHSEGQAGPLCNLSTRKISNYVDNNDAENAIEWVFMLLINDRFLIITMEGSILAWAINTLYTTEHVTYSSCVRVT